MSRLLIAGLLVCVGGSWPALHAGAQDRVHVFGPAGSPMERRVLVALEPAAGGCVPAGTTVRWGAETEGVEVTPEARVGECTRWIRVSASPPRERVTLIASTDTFSGRVALALGAHEHLEVRVRRRGDRLVAHVDGAPPAEVAVTAYVDGEAVALERRDDRFEIAAPERALIGVVARSQTMAGASALANPGGGGPRAAILPAGLAIEAGGTPRVAAFLVVTDARGHLSRSLPLEVQSERGHLRSLRWLSRGVAAVGLSAPLDVDSLDLRVAIRGATLATAELEVVSDWPGRAELGAPSTVTLGEPLPVRARAATVEGSPVPSARLRIRCGEVEAPADEPCLPSTEGPLTVSIVADVDGRMVPLATTSVQVQPVPVEPAPQEPARPAPPGRAPPVWIAALGRGGYDFYQRPMVGGGLRMTRAVTPWLRLGGSVGYDASFLNARGREQAVDRAVSGWRHRLAGTAIGELTFGGPELAVFVRAELGLAWVHAEAEVDALDGSGDVAQLLARLAVGPRWRVGAVELGVDAGVETAVDLTERAWGAAPLGGLLEVNGAIPIH